MLWYRRLRYGYAFRRIRMSQPRYAVVDPADYDRLKGYQWVVKSGGKAFYAQRYGPCRKGARNPTIVYMHQEILKVPKGMVVDHMNHDGMDNRRANLRAATHSQNLCNRKKRSGAMYSKYKGVHWHKLNKKWSSRVTYQKKTIELGYFENEIEAAKAYDEAAKIHHGEFACLNFPEKT